MPTEQIEIPDSIKHLPHTPAAASLIDKAYDRIEAFMLRDLEVIDNFVTCDFHLLDQALTWIEQNHLVAGNRFCELGAGFAIGAMLAAQRGMEAVGIEIEPVLVEESSRLATDLENEARIYQGSFVPRAAEGVVDTTGIQNVDTDAGDVYDEIGLTMDEFDLFFAFPWPGENGFFESVIETCGSDGALLLTYRGREGMDLVRIS